MSDMLSPHDAARGHIRPAGRSHSSRREPLAHPARARCGWNGDGLSRAGSPDSRRIAFTTDESGTTQVVVQALPGPGPRLQVSTTGGTEPVWSRDGRRLFYRSGQKIAMAEIITAPSLAVKSRTSLFDDVFLQATERHANYEVSPDATRLLLLKSVGEERLIIVRNWREELRARLRPRSSQSITKELAGWRGGRLVSPAVELRASHVDRRGQRPERRGLPTAPDMTHEQREGVTVHGAHRADPDLHQLLRRRSQAERVGVCSHRRPFRERSGHRHGRSRYPTPLQWPGRRVEVHLPSPGRLPPTARAS